MAKDKNYNKMVHKQRIRDKIARKEAIRQDNIRSRSIRNAAEQIRHLDNRLGFGVGAVRERKRLQELLAKGK